MSDGAAGLGAEAVDFLLELLELREPRLSGAAAELRPDPAWRLMAAGLMVPQDHEAGSASLADHDDVPVSLIWSEQHSALAYFSPAVGLVPVPHDRLVRHRADVEAVLAAATARMDLPRGRVPHALVEGLLWEIGEVRLSRRPARVPLWFARRLVDPAVVQQVVGAARARPHNRLPVAPDAAMIAAYADMVFGWCEGWVAVRALAEKGGPDRAPHTPFLPADAELPAKLAVQAQWAAAAGMALYVIPGTVPEPGQASAEHIAQMQVVLVDLDRRRRAARRAHLREPARRPRARRGAPLHRRRPAGRIPGRPLLRIRPRPAGGGDPAAGAVTRRPDWAVRLAALLSAVETRAFDAHRWNCGRFAQAAVEAVTGSRPQVRVLPDLVATADSAGFPRIAPLQARMGDIVLAPDPERLGVVLDAGRVAFVGPRGLLRAPITLCTTAWRIG
jgi:hypothetical protein